MFFYQYSTRHKQFNNLRTHQSQYLKRNKISDISTWYVSTSQGLNKVRSKRLSAVEAQVNYQEDHFHYTPGSQYHVNTIHLIIWNGLTKSEGVNVPLTPPSCAAMCPTPPPCRRPLHFPTSTQCRCPQIQVSIAGTTYTR